MYVNCFFPDTGDPSIATKVRLWRWIYRYNALPGIKTKPQAKQHGAPSPHANWRGDLVDLVVVLLQAAHDSLGRAGQLLHPREQTDEVFLLRGVPLDGHSLFEREEGVVFFGQQLRDVELLAGVLRGGFGFEVEHEPQVLPLRAARRRATRDGSGNGRAGGREGGAGQKVERSIMPCSATE